MTQVAAIVGAGLIGRAWAMVFARAGWHVRLFDSAPAQLESAHGLIAARPCGAGAIGPGRGCGGGRGTSVDIATPR